MKRRIEWGRDIRKIQLHSTMRPEIWGQQHQRTNKRMRGKNLKCSQPLDTPQSIKLHKFIQIAIFPSLHLFFWLFLLSISPVCGTRFHISPQHYLLAPPQHSTTTIMLSSIVSRWCCVLCSEKKMRSPILRGDEMNEKGRRKKQMKKREKWSTKTNSKRYRTIDDCVFSTYWIHSTTQPQYMTMDCADAYRLNIGYRKQNDECDFEFYV